jgi:hypothetical protein
MFRKAAASISTVLLIAGFAACSDDDSSSVLPACDSYCAAAAECDPQFSYQHCTLGCRDLVSRNGAACEQAFADAGDCMEAAADCNAAVQGCAQELAAIDAACPDQ